jgi:hypothetical protein
LDLMSDDVNALIAAMHERGIMCGPAQDRGWGVLTEVPLPGGGKLGIYQPRHTRPTPMRPGRKVRELALRAGNATRKASKPNVRRRRPTTG